MVITCWSEIKRKARKCPLHLEIWRSSVTLWRSGSGLDGEHQEAEACEVSHDEEEMETFQWLVGQVRDRWQLRKM